MAEEQPSEALPRKRRDSWFRAAAGGPGPALGRAIKARRAELGLGRRALADGADVSYPYLAEIENGTKPGSQRVLGAIAEELGLALHELLARAAALDAEEPVIALGSPSPALAAPASGLDRRSELRDLVASQLAAVPPDVADDVLVSLVGEDRIRAIVRDELRRLVAEG